MFLYTFFINYIRREKSFSQTLNYRSLVSRNTRNESKITNASISYSLSNKRRLEFSNRFYWRSINDGRIT
jgi:hypothetical protein